MRDRLVAIARSYVGVRFCHQGRSRDEGLDCLGLLLAVAREAELELQGVPTDRFDRRDYGAKPDTQMLQHRLQELLLPIAPCVMRPADIVLLRIEGRPQHLAMLSHYPHEETLGMIHAYAPARRVVEHRLDEVWRGAVATAYQLPTLE